MVDHSIRSPARPASGGSKRGSAFLPHQDGAEMEALMIGVSGTRGTIGGMLTPPVVSQMAAAVAGRIG
jgi:hypothetical protein